MNSVLLRNFGWDSVFNDSFHPFYHGNSKRETWPSVDILELQDKFVLEVDVPGFQENEIKIELNEGRLTLEGDQSEASQSSSASEGSWVLRERPERKFKRKFVLGEGLNLDQIEAHFENGTLKVTIPKSEKVLPKVIAISKKHLQ